MVQVIVVPVAVGPRRHLNEIRHEGGNGTLEDGSVSTDDVFVVHLRLVKLLDD